MAHGTTKIWAVLGIALQLCVPLIPRSVSGQTVGKHPLAEARRLPANTIRVSVGAATSSDEMAQARALMSRKPIVSLGALETPNEQVFGSITDIAFDRQGRMLVLDGRLNVLRLFSAGGAYIATIARPGSGPGEVRWPRALVVDGRGRILLLDAGQRVHIFEPQGAGYRFDRAARLPVDPVDMCVMRGSLYVRGARYGDTLMIHQLDSSFGVIRSFGVAYVSKDPMTDFQVSQGKVICLEDRNIVVAAVTALVGEVRAFSGDGRQLWVVAFDGYRPSNYTIGSDGSRTVTVPEDGYHRVRSIATDGPDHLLVQVGLETRESAKAHDLFAALTTFRISTSTGAAVSLGNSLPLLMSAPEPLIASQFDDPYPGIEIRRGPVVRRQR